MAIKSLPNRDHRALEVNASCFLEKRKLNRMTRNC